MSVQTPFSRQQLAACADEPTRRRDGRGEMKSSCWTPHTLRAWRTGQQAWNPGERLGLEGEHPDDRDIYREVLSLLTRPKTYMEGGQPWKAEICACSVP